MEEREKEDKIPLKENNNTPTTDTESTPQKRKSPSTSTCNTHPSHNLDFICLKRECKECEICGVCLRTTHKYHKFEHKSRIVEYKKKEVERLTKKYVEYLPQYKNIDEIHKQALILGAKVEKTFSVMQSKLREVFKTVLQDKFESTLNTSTTEYAKIVKFQKRNGRRIARMMKKVDKEDRRTGTHVSGSYLNYFPLKNFSGLETRTNRAVSLFRQLKLDTCYAEEELNVLMPKMVALVNKHVIKQITRCAGYIQTHKTLQSYDLLSVILGYLSLSNLYSASLTSRHFAKTIQSRNILPSAFLITLRIPSQIDEGDTNTNKILDRFRELPNSRKERIIMNLKAQNPRGSIPLNLKECEGMEGMREGEKELLFPTVEDTLLNQLPNFFSISTVDRNPSPQISAGTLSRWSYSRVLNFQLQCGGDNHKELAIIRRVSEITLPDALPVKQITIFTHMHKYKNMSRDECSIFELFDTPMCKHILHSNGYISTTQCKFISKKYMQIESHPEICHRTGIYPIILLKNYTNGRFSLGDGVFAPWFRVAARYITMKVLLDNNLLGDNNHIRCVEGGRFRMLITGSLFGEDWDDIKLISIGGDTDADTDDDETWREDDNPPHSDSAE